MEDLNLELFSGEAFERRAVQAGAADYDRADIEQAAENDKQHRSQKKQWHNDDLLMRARYITRSSLIQTSSTQEPVVVPAENAMTPAKHARPQRMPGADQFAGLPFAAD